MSRFSLDAANPAQVIAALAAADELQSFSWLRSTLDWLHGLPFAERTQHLRGLVAALSAHPDTPRLIGMLARAGKQMSAVRVFAETGLPRETAWTQETASRIATRLLPAVENDGDLFGILQSLGLNEADAVWIESLPNELFQYWGDVFAARRETFQQAARVVAIRCGSLGLHRDIQELFPDLPITESPFFELPERIAEGACPEWESFLARAREYLDRAHQALETHGVTTNLVFRLDLAGAQLARLDELLRLAAGAGNGRTFAATIVRGFAEQRSLLALIDSGARRLARKVVEHTGRAGEHYIAGDRLEWHHQLWGGLGAGAVCVWMAAVKYAIPPIQLSPLLHGLAWTANYTAGFMTMQFFHLTLASKVPSMTAAALADAFERDDGFESEVMLITSLIRSQFLVTMTNLATALPLGFAFSMLWHSRFGHPFMTVAEAQHGVHGLHPLQSWTVIFAAITGVALWLASLAAGWTSNWMTFRKLPAAIAGSRRLHAILGRFATERIGRFAGTHLGGFGGNLALGVLLGLAPLVATFIGIPLEVRHVTLSSASLTMYFHALWVADQLAWQAAAWALGAIAITGVLNISVSFALGLRLAMRSRGVDLKTRRALWRQMGRAFRLHPGRFFIPGAGPTVLVADEVKADDGVGR